MEYRILGRFEAIQDGQPVLLGGWQQRALLAILLIHREHPVSVDRLIDELWGERPPPAAVRTVRVYISQLRKVLGVKAVQTRDRGYLLHVEPGALDADRFERLVAEARRLSSDGDVATARVRMDEALSIWLGPPLPGFEDAGFAQHEIGRLEELRLGALEDRFDYAIKAGEATEIVPALKELCAAHPLRERFGEQLMIALYRAGRQADALAAYRRTQAALDEIGVLPSTRLSDLHLRMLQHDPQLLDSRSVDTQVQPRQHRYARFVVAGAAIIAAAVAVLLAGHDRGPAAAHAAQRIVLVIGAAPPTDQPAQTAPTLVTMLADGADQLRRQGVPLQVKYMPGSSAANDRERILSAAAHAQLVVLFPALPSDLKVVAEAARSHPRTHFVMIDNSVQQLPGPVTKNVAGMPFDGYELGYLAGYLGALQTAKRGTVSAVAGYQIAPVVDILRGFRAGVRRADRTTRVIVGYSQSFVDPTPCERVANSQISAGSQVVFDVAGVCGFGALDAAGIRGVWGIGIDTDLSSVGPAVLASAVKRFDRAVLLAVQLYTRHRLPQGQDALLNLGNDGIALVGLSSAVTPDVRAKVEQVAEALRSSDIAKLQ